MESNNFSYNNESVDELIFTLSDNMLLLNIEDQIKNKNTKINYIEILFDKINACLAHIDVDDTELISRVQEFKSDMLSKIKTLLEDNLHISIELKEYYSNPEKFIILIYEFFVLREQSNITNIIFNFIKREKKSLFLRFKENVNKKDLTYSNNKKELEKEKILLLMNLNEIIEMVNIQEPEQAIKDMILDSEELTNYTILNLMIKEELTFTPEFIEGLKESLEKNKIRIIWELRELILNM